MDGHPYGHKLKKTQTRVHINYRVVRRKALEEGEEYEYISNKNVEPIPSATPKNEDVPSAVTTLVQDIRKLLLDNLKHISLSMCHIQ